MRRLIGLALLTAAFSAASPISSAEAGPLLLQADGVVMGVSGLVVDQVDYDVSFEFGAYSDVFAESAPTFLLDYTVVDANGSGGAAARAARSIAALFTENGMDAVGGGEGTYWYFIVPFVIVPPAVAGDSSPILGVFTNTEPGFFPGLWITDGGAPSFSTFDDPRMYAVFTKVPEPSTLLIVTASLSVFAAIRVFRFRDATTET